MDVLLYRFFFAVLDGTKMVVLGYASFRVVVDAECARDELRAT